MFKGEFNLWLAVPEHERYEWYDRERGLRFYHLYYVLTTIRNRGVETALVFDKDENIPKQIQVNTKYTEWFTAYYPTFRLTSYDFIYVGRGFHKHIEDILPLLGNGGMMMFDGYKTDTDMTIILDVLGQKLDITAVTFARNREKYFTIAYLERKHL